MPRPKGSKNNAKTPVVIVDYAAELEKKSQGKTPWKQILQHWRPTLMG